MGGSGGIWPSFSPALWQAHHAECVDRTVDGTVGASDNPLLLRRQKSGFAMWKRSMAPEREAGLALSEHQPYAASSPCTTMASAATWTKLAHGVPRVFAQGDF
jgi:hypothetical protein